VVDPAIERLQDRLCVRLGFVADHHRLDIYGICRTCAVSRSRPTGRLTGRIGGTPR
jgi:Fe2+ or Zn2+ uptake regulation protein